MTISFSLAPHVALGTAVKKVQEAALEVLPLGVMGNFIGEALVFMETFKAIKWLIILSILVIYLILGILYESFLHPLTVLSALPIAGFGALLTLLIFGQTLSLYSIVGVIVLIGLVQKNGIMMIDYALAALKKPGISVEEATLEACHARFRPILMTTLAAMAGVLPIAIGIGEGGIAKESLGLAVIGGLCFSQALTLFITPILFVTLENWNRSRKKVRIDEKI